MDKNSDITFVFFHYGGVPDYLKYAIESARYFNNESRIILVNDSNSIMPKHWKIEAYDLRRFATPALSDFRSVYVHISVFKERYERFVLERWFLLDELRKQLDCGHTVALDSDLMVFPPARRQSRQT